MFKITYYEKLIQEKRKKTPFREFVKEIASWNVVNIYKRNGQISRYPETARSPLVGEKFWENSIDYIGNFEKDFFDSFIELFNKVPFQNLMDFWNNENCSYADAVFWWAKNTYLSFVVWYNAENIAYSAYCYTNIKDIYNGFLCSIDNTNIYMSGGITWSSNIYYSKYISHSADIWFSTNMIWCQECILCDRLENQKYCIRNKQYSKEEYMEKKGELMMRKNLFATLHQSIVSNAPDNIGSENITGDYILKSHDVENGLWSIKIHNSRNVVISNWWDISEHFYDAVDTGIDSDHLYGICAWWNKSHHLYCSSQIDTGSYIYYSFFIANCHHCLGCIWLKNKSYCILNKQYTKEEWEEKACDIFASMEADGTLGDFFPASMNPFYFNDTLAYLIDDSFTKEEVEADGYLWRDEPIRADIPEGMKVVKNTELEKYQGFRTRHPEWSEGSKSMDSSYSQNDETTEWYIDPEVMNVVISDETWNYYRIVKMEYEFLMKHALPLPTMHWLDRMKMGFQMR